MKTIMQCRWRVRWINKWITTSYDSTEEDIRVEHPEAERVPGTERFLDIPESPEEELQRLYAVSAGQTLGRDPRGPPEGS